MSLQTNFGKGIPVKASNSMLWGNRKGGGKKERKWRGEGEKMDGKWREEKRKRELIMRENKNKLHFTRGVGREEERVPRWN